MNFDSGVTLLGWNFLQRASKVATITIGPREILDPVLRYELKGCVVWVDFEIRRHQAERVFERAAVARRRLASLMFKKRHSFPADFFFRFVHTHNFTDNFNFYIANFYTYTLKKSQDVHSLLKRKNACGKKMLLLRAFCLSSTPRVTIFSYHTFVIKCYAISPVFPSRIAEYLVRTHRRMTFRTMTFPE